MEEKKTSTKYQLSARDVIIGLAALGLIIALIFGQTIASFFVGPAPAKYTTGLKAEFSIQDTTLASLLTSGVTPTIYVAGTDPYGRMFPSSTGAISNRLGTAAYSSTEGYWMAALDTGSYTVLCADAGGSKTKYPSVTSVSVPGTDDVRRIVVMSPSTLGMVERASLTVSTSIKAYNATSGGYDITVSTLNVTLYSKWVVTFDYYISGDQKVIAAGRVYTTEITGLAVTSAQVDGTSSSVSLDRDASDDTLTGYYTAFPNNWIGGPYSLKHSVTLYFEKVGSPSATTMTVTLADNYAVQNTQLKWWTYTTTSVTVET